MDSSGETIDFLFAASGIQRRLNALFRKALCSTGNPVPQVINVDQNRTYPAALGALQAEGRLPRRVRLR